MKFRYVVLFIFAIIINISFCAKQQPQVHLQASHPVLSNLLTKSSLGNGLISLVNMYSQMKQDNQDWSDLYAALDLLKESLNQKIDNENADFDSDQVDYEAAVAAINALLVEYQGQEAILEQERVGLTDRETLLQNELTNLNTQLEFAQQSKQAEQEYLDRITEQHEQELEDFDQAIQLLGQAQSKLQEARAQAQEAGFQNFIQMSTENYNSYSILLEKKLSKVKNSKQIFYKPITQIFSQMGNKQDLDATTLDNAIEAIQNLITLFAQGKVTLIQNYDADFSAHTTLRRQFGMQISQLNTVQIPAQQTLIETVENELEVNGQSLADVQSNIRIQQGNLDQENQSWQQRIDIHELLIPKLNEELQIVLNAEQVLEAKQPRQ